MVNKIVDRTGWPIEYSLHAFEAGRRGKPDELDTSMANLLLAHLLEQNPEVRSNPRVFGTADKEGPLVIVGGEISDFVQLTPSDVERIVLDRYNEVHKTDLQGIRAHMYVNRQSRELAKNSQNRVAGDSSTPLAFAFANTPYNLPAERAYAVELRNIFDSIYQNNGVVDDPSLGVDRLEGLRADGKIQVIAAYEGIRFVKIDSVRLALQHEESLPNEELQRKAKTIVQNYFRAHYGLKLDVDRIGVNSAWHEGGWGKDMGNSEAKPHRDSFSTWGTGTDSYSGEDWTKTDGSGTLLAKYIANNVVENDLAQFVRVMMPCDIGSGELRLNIDTYGTRTRPDIEQLVRARISTVLRDAAKTFELDKPKTYRDFADDCDYFFGKSKCNEIVRLV